MARYQRIMAVGCTHGHLIHPKLRKQVLAFRKAFNPQIRVDLGDLIDTAAGDQQAGAGAGPRTEGPMDGELRKYRVDRTVALVVEAASPLHALEVAMHKPEDAVLIDEGVAITVFREESESEDVRISLSAEDVQELGLEEEDD